LSNKSNGPGVLAGNYAEIIDRGDFVFLAENYRPLVNILEDGLFYVGRNGDPDKLIGTGYGDSLTDISPKALIYRINRK
jgi:hypothetical protein